MTDIVNLNINLQSLEDALNLVKSGDYQGDIVNLNINLQSLEDALKSNQETIINFKYDGKLGGKSSVLCSVMWDANEVLILPRPEIIVFPKFLLEYAISLNK